MTESDQVATGMAKGCLLIFGIVMAACMLITFVGCAVFAFI